MFAESAHSFGWNSVLKPFAANIDGMISANSWTDFSSHLGSYALRGATYAGGLALGRAAVGVATTKIAARQSVASVGAEAAVGTLATQNSLYITALGRYGASDLTIAGRALTKHPEVIGATKSTLRQTLRSDASINRAAHSALKDIMRNGVTTTPTVPRYGQITQTKIPGGFGARWHANGKFIGFINL